MLHITDRINWLICYKSKHCQLAVAHSFGWLELSSFSADSVKPVSDDRHDCPFEFACVQTYVGCDSIIILYPNNHFVVLSSFLAILPV